MNIHVNLPTTRQPHKEACCKYFWIFFILPSMTLAYNLESALQCDLSNQLPCTRHIIFLMISFSQFHAMDALHQSGYDLSKSINRVIPEEGPILCRDEMEEWSSGNAIFVTQEHTILNNLLSRSSNFHPPLYRLLDE